MFEYKKAEFDYQFIEFLNLETPIDKESAIKSLDGSQKLYYSLLRRFEGV